VPATARAPHSPMDIIRPVSQLLRDKRLGHAWQKLAAGAVSLTVLVSFAAPAGATGFNASLTAAKTTFSSGTLQLKSTPGTTSCYSTGTGSGGSVSVNSATCASGSPIPAGSLSATTLTSTSTTLSSVGTANASAAAITSASCGVAQLSDIVGGDTALAYGGLTYQSSGPLGSQGITVDGSTGWAETTTSYNNPEGFTAIIWLNTTKATGGIMGFGSQVNPTTGTPADHDRQLWIDPSGKLVWGIYSNAVYQLTSPSVVDTGSWVMAAATVGSAGTTLYVNGAQVASSTTPTTAQNYTGWWSLGYASIANWNDVPSSYYFSGSLAQAAVIPSQLTAAQVSSLYGDSSLASYTAGVEALSPTNYWPMNDSGAVPYEGSVPGATASTTLADYSGNSDTGTAEGGTTLGTPGPPTLTANAITLNGASGFVETAKSYANPETFSVMGWFETSSASGGTILSFTSAQANTTPTTFDRTLWLDSAGNLVWEVVNGTSSTSSEVISPSTYNNGQWHFVVAEIGAAGQQLWVDGAKVASTATTTSAENYTGYWHLGWGYESGWANSPAISYLNGNLAETAVVPVQLSASQISTLYTANSTAALALDVAQLAPSAYWPLQDSASNVCGTVEATVQETVGTTNSCIYPAGTGACPGPSSTYLLPGLFSRSMTAPTSSAAATIKISLEESAASSTTIAGLHMLPFIGFGTATSSNSWSAQVGYPYASVEL
jgi:Concanavalin A-like lectin/glucanases superfamily